MNLHIRLYINFWTNRKTAKLRSLIGNDALWIMPRLWSYAAENQPDGNFSKYSAQEIALHLGYNGDAQALLQALLQACFIDEDMILHDWSEHNGYHDSFAKRAKKAAKARWDKERAEKERIRKDRIGKEASIAPSNAQASNGDQFNKFWLAYPKKKSKGSALKAWGKIKPNIELVETILKSLEIQKKSTDWIKNDGQYIPYPATWLNDMGWLNEIGGSTLPKKETPVYSLTEIKEAEKRAYLEQVNNGDSK